MVDKSSNSPKKPKTTKTAVRVGKFAIIGAILALFNFLIYTFLARVVFQNNDLLWVDSIISYTLATILAYFLHSKITWKERHITKLGIVMFFIWNGITAFLISPSFTWLFSLMTPVYEFAFSIFNAIHIPFDYNFVESTGVFCFTTAVTMVLNYLFYDKLVFDDTFVKKLLKKFKKPTKKQVFATILYILPILFSFLTVFLITTSGEDNFQGAGNLANGVEIDVTQDAINAFNYNSRITDVYAWSVIDFYDHQYAFSWDTVLRLIDVVAISAVFFLATYIILGRKPKLLIKDSLVFCLTFFVFIITPFGRAFYHEFSMIHNYVPLALITLLFSIPYVNFIYDNNRESKHPIFFPILMLLAGVLFGMSATVTPLAFLGTVILYIIIRRKHLKKPSLWFYIGLIGAIAGFLICWLVGSGVDHYTSAGTANTFDYVAFSDVFSNIPKILFHEVYNFALVFIPFIGIIIACIIFTKNRKDNLKLKNADAPLRNFILAFLLFIIIHILGASLIKSPPRLLIPAYLAAIILSFRIFMPILNFNKVLTTLIFTATVATVITHGFLLIKYHNEMSIVLTNIKNSEKTTICISPEETRPARVKILDLAQANMIVDWGDPEPIYQKEIVNCE